MDKIKELFAKLKQKVLDLVKQVKNYFSPEPQPLVNLEGLRSLDVNNPLKVGEVGVPGPVSPVDPLDSYHYTLTYVVEAPKKKAKKKAKKKTKKSKKSK